MGGCVVALWDRVYMARETGEWERRGARAIPGQALKASSSQTLNPINPKLTDSPVPACFDCSSGSLSRQHGPTKSHLERDLWSFFTFAGPPLAWRPPSHRVIELEIQTAETFRTPTLKCRKSKTLNPKP